MCLQPSQKAPLWVGLTVKPPPQMQWLDMPWITEAKFSIVSVKAVFLQERLPVKNVGKQCFLQSVFL